MARTKGKMKTRTIAVLIGIGVAVIGGGVAFAYFSSTGAGTGAATAGSAAVPIVVKQTSTLSGLAPGVAPIALSGNFDNGNTGLVYVANVTATVASTDKGSACLPANFVIGGTSTPNANIPAGNAQGNWSGLTIGFVNTAANQDGCKGAIANIVYAAS